MAYFAEILSLHNIYSVGDSLGLSHQVHVYYWAALYIVLVFNNCPARRIYTFCYVVCRYNMLSTNINFEYVECRKALHFQGALWRYFRFLAPSHPSSSGPIYIAKELYIYIAPPLPQHVQALPPISSELCYR